MGRARLLLAASLLALLLGAAGALAWWSATETPPAGAQVRVSIVGPDGPLFNGTIRVANATALSALQAAAREANLTLGVQEYPGMGTYVSAIGPYAAHGASGWIYEVDGAPGDRSASRAPVHDGDVVAWRWTDG